jgi:hypothetical protein
MERTSLHSQLYQLLKSFKHSQGNDRNTLAESAFLNSRYTTVYIAQPKNKRFYIPNGQYNSVRLGIFKTHTKHKMTPSNSMQGRLRISVSRSEQYMCPLKHSNVYVRFEVFDDRGSGVRFPAEAGNFSLLHRIHTGSGAHSASYPMGTGGSFPGDKSAEGVKLTTYFHLEPRSKNAWRYTFKPVCLQGVVLS